jgi:hypothetical protein
MSAVCRNDRKSITRHQIFEAVLSGSARTVEEFRN